MIVLLAGFLLGLVLCIIYFAKLIKTINTVKRVLRTGSPDDRVSPFAAVIGILCFLAMLWPGLSRILEGGTENILSGASALLSAFAALFFSILIFRFRSGMRALGVYKGAYQVMQPTNYR